MSFAVASSVNFTFHTHYTLHITLNANILFYEDDEFYGFNLRAELVSVLTSPFFSFHLKTLNLSDFGKIILQK